MNNSDSENNQNSSFDPDSHFDPDEDNKSKQDDLLRRLAESSDEQKPAKPELADTQPHHPTGSPESTGGWYSEIQNPQQPDQENADRH